MFRRAAIIALLAAPSSAVAAPDFNAAAPNAPDQQPAFPEQTRAPVLSDAFDLETEVLAEGLEHPWGMAELPDGRWLVTERAGRLRLWGPEDGLSAPIEGLPEMDLRGQGGLLDVVVGEDFAQTRRLWFSFVENRPVWRSLITELRRESATRTAVATGVLSSDGRRIDEMQVIFRQDPVWHSQGHYGARLVLDGQGGLFITLGDREQGVQDPMAQQVDSHIGKIVRIGLMGEVLDDRPAMAGGLPEIWSMGHRNVQAAALGPDGALWTVEHGTGGGDELNRPEAGRNYGWPLITYGADYSGQPISGGATAQEGLEQPLYYWDPAIAPSGLDFYDGAMFPEWQGDALIGGLAGMALVRLELDGQRVTGEARYLQDMARIRDVAVARDGAILVLTDDPDGQMIRITRGD